MSDQNNNFIRFNYFNIFRKNENNQELISPMRVKYNKNIWIDICKNYLSDEQWIEKCNDDLISSIYNMNLKDYINELFPDVYDLIKEMALEYYKVNIEDENIIICLGTINDYRKIDEDFDNELLFIEYCNSEISRLDKNRLISKNILENAGFEETTLENMKTFYKDNYNIDNYVSYRVWTDQFDRSTDKILKLDIDNGLTNSKRTWHLHIDNNSCQTIGSADIDNVWEFNTLMQVFGSKFRL